MQTWLVESVEPFSWNAAIRIANSWDKVAVIGSFLGGVFLSRGVCIYFHSHGAGNSSHWSMTVSLYLRAQNDNWIILTLPSNTTVAEYTNSLADKIPGPVGQLSVPTMHLLGIVHSIVLVSLDK